MATEPRLGTKIRSRIALPAELASVPLVLGLAGYLFVLLSNLAEIVSQLSWNSDAASLPMMAATLKSVAHPGFVILSIQPNFLTLAFDYLVASSHTAWESFAPMVDVITVAIVVITTQKLAGRGSLAWMYSLVIAVCISPWLAFTQLMQAYHDTTILATVLYAAYLVWLARTDEISSRHRVVCAAMALFTAAVVLSDSLLLMTALGPAILLAVYSWWREHMPLPRAAWLALPAIAGVGAYGLVAVAHHFKVILGDVLFGTPLQPASLSQIPNSVKLLFDGLARMGNGDFYDLAPPAWKLAILIVGLAFLTGIGWLLINGARTVLGRGDVDAASKQVTVFWAMSVVALSAGFVSNSAIQDRQSFRYLGVVVFALAATIPLFLSPILSGATSLRKTLVAMAFAAYAVVAALQLQGATNMQFFRFGQTQTFPQLISALQSRGLTHGYAAYWDASSITYQTNQQIQIAPVWQAEKCNPNYCAGTYNAVESWYHSNVGTSFLVVDPSPMMAVYVSQVLPSTGTPTSSFQVDRFTVYVFNHDIGSVVDVPAPQHGHSQDGSSY